MSNNESPTPKAAIVCAGAALWDTVGRSDGELAERRDVPGIITQVPGGVALNIAMAVAARGVPVSLLSAIGRDNAGDALISEITQRGIASDFVHRSEHYPTDHYMAIEAGDQLIAAIADANSLEALSQQALAPLRDGRLGSAQAPYDGCLVIEGNLTVDAMESAINDAIFAKADLRLAPASPGKAERMACFFGQKNATLYVNLQEANSLLNQRHRETTSAAQALVAAGLGRALVTDGSNPVALAATDKAPVIATPPSVTVLRVTGAGDFLMASHIVAEQLGMRADAALAEALEQTARYIATPANAHAHLEPA